ncbi:MAG TPA: glycosyltransferase family 9 protein, partial [Ignavibacteriaceae bacterium]
KDSEIKVKKYLRDNHINKFITIAPGSVWETKKYPVDYFKKIASHFIGLNYQIVLVGGHTDKSLCETIKKDFENNVFITAGDFSFIDTIELLKSTLLLICNDSAPTHLGVCANIPVLTIYCSTSPRFGFYPYNAKSDYISFDDLNCKPCGIHGFNLCPTGTFDCAKLLPPEKVVQKAEKLLANAD